MNEFQQESKQKQKLNGFTYDKGFGKKVALEVVVEVKECVASGGTYPPHVTVSYL